MLFWWNGSAHIRDGKKATKLAQIAVSPIQRREHEGKWTRFHLLPDLCPLCRSRCHEKSLTSVWSPLPTQLQSVSESVGSGLQTQFEWVNATMSLPLTYPLFARSFHEEKLGPEYWATLLWLVVSKLGSWQHFLHWNRISHHLTKG